MAEKELNADDIERKVHDLAAAMNEVKSAQADRDDVVVELKHAKLSRLELLAEDLSGVFADIPKDNEMFEFALMRGETPRLWIDMTSFIRMGKDGRQFEFVKDTRHGRTILGSSTNREKIGGHVTKYVAERMLERERMLEGDWVDMRSNAGNMSDEDTKAVISSNVSGSTAKQESRRKGLGLMRAFIWFLFGLVIGLCVLATAFVFEGFQPLAQWIAGIGQ